MIVTISGASGVGKDTLVDFLFYILPNTKFLRSYTTRKPRLGDRGYTYIGNDEFLAMQERGLFAWAVGSYDNMYGTSISDLVEMCNDKETIWFSVVVPKQIPEFIMWARRLKGGGVLSVYIYCKDTEILRQRLIKRGDKDIEKRLNDLSSFNLEASRQPSLVWVDNSGELEVTKRTVANIIKEAGFLDL